MVDPHPLKRALSNQPRQHAVHKVEQVFVFDPHGCQIVDIEEAAVIDLVRRKPP